MIANVGVVARPGKRERRGRSGEKANDGGSRGSSLCRSGHCYTRGTSRFMKVHERRENPLYLPFILFYFFSIFFSPSKK